MLEGIHRDIIRAYDGKHAHQPGARFLHGDYGTGAPALTSVRYTNRTWLDALPRRMLVQVLYVKSNVKKKCPPPKKVGDALARALEW